jgi:hypothetical protein
MWTCQAWEAETRHPQARRTVLQTVLLLCLAATGVSPARAGPTQELLIAALFDAGLAGPELDANGDDRVTVADVLLLPPSTAVPSATGSRPVPTATATRSPTPPASNTPTRRPPRTRTPTTTATSTPAPPSGTPTQVPTATPSGLIFAGTVSDLVPHAPGDTLVYRVTTASTTQTETLAVVSSEGSSFTVDLTRGTVHERPSYIDDGSTLRYVSVLDLVRNVRTTCDPAAVRLAAPMRVGDMFMTTSRCEIRLVPSGVFVGEFTLIETYEPLGVVPGVTVPAGTYAPAIRIRQTSTLGEEVNEVHLAPGVGIVRRSTESNTGMRLYELVDGTIGGQSVKR